MIVAEGLTKRFGDTTAVSDVSFTVQPGKVTGFLGPNGAGKSTTMRMIVGLDRPSAGHVTVNGHPYRSSRAPLTEVGVLMDAKAVHTGRTAHAHLRAMGSPLIKVAERLSLPIGEQIAGSSGALAPSDKGIARVDPPTHGPDSSGSRLPYAESGTFARQA